MRTPRSLTPLLGTTVVAAAIVFGACTSTGKPTGTPGSMRPALSAPPATTRPAASADPNANLPAAVVLVGRPGSSDLELTEVQTGQPLMDVPFGATDAAWHRLVTATADATKTTLSDLAGDGSFAGPSVELVGRWRMPTIGTDRMPAGVSADGSTIALVPADAGTAGAAATATATSQFAIVRHLDGGQPTRDPTAALKLATVIELPGAFDFDAISPDGAILYVVEHLKGEAGAYEVRAVDVASGRLRDGAIVDKRNLGEAMAGWPVGQVRRSDGVVLTLYRGTEHPFVHALNTADAWAVCIDLPAVKGSDAAAADWGLTARADDRNVYAINATLGLAAEIDATDLVVKRTAMLKTADSGPGSGALASTSLGSAGPASIELAKFGHDGVGPAGRVVVSPDGTTVWAAGSTGIVAIATKDLAVSRRMLAGTAVDGIAVAPDGSAIFALVRNGGHIVALDPSTGRSLGTMPGGGYDRLLAAAPW